MLKIHLEGAEFLSETGISVFLIICKGGLNVHTDVC